MTLRFLRSTVVQRLPDSGVRLTVRAKAVDLTLNQAIGAVLAIADSYREDMPATMRRGPLKFHGDAASGELKIELDGEKVTLDDDDADVFIQRLATAIQAGKKARGL